MIDNPPEMLLHPQTTPVKIICTIGPASKNAEVMRRLQARDVALVRINLSHVPGGEIEDYIRFLQQFDIPVAMDTEGSQIRTGKFPTASGAVAIAPEAIVKIYGKNVVTNGEQIHFVPAEIVHFFNPGDMIAIDFNSVLLKVVDVSRLADDGYVTCQACIRGEIGSNKVQWSASTRGTSFTGRTNSSSFKPWSAQGATVFSCTLSLDRKSRGILPPR